MQTPSPNKALSPLLAATALALAATHCHAHDGEDHHEPYATPGLRLHTAAVLRQLDASSTLPSQGLPGYLLRGDPGVEQRRGQLEHGVLALSYRANARWSAELAVGAHGRDPAHLEAAALYWQADAWRMSLGRQAPAQGRVIGQAGHLDHFGLMPLAKQAQTDGAWLADGAQLSLTRNGSGLQWHANLGLWSGRHVRGGSFPAGTQSPVAAHLHLGVQGQSAHGDWALDAFANPQPVRQRGARFIGSSGAHSHQAPVCDASLSQVVCLDGDATLWGLSAHWASRAWPVSLSAAWLGRDEHGSLQSKNGSADYRGHTQGAWLQALWQFKPDWQTGLRVETLSALQSLRGPGAQLVALDAGLDRYAPLRRHALMLNYRLASPVSLSLELGQERAQGLRSQSYAALRFAYRWAREFNTD